MYQIRQQTNSFQVVFTIDGGSKVVRVLNTFACRADAERLMSDLNGWRL
jgi:hypothetical protein